MFVAAALQNPSATGPFRAIGLVVVVLCIVRRNEDIGGWLMFFYYQMYASVVLFLLSALRSIETFSPSYWSESGDYAVYLASILPRYAAFLFVGIVASVLLSRKTHTWVIHLRIALGAALGLMMLPLLLDALFFKDALVWNVLRVLMLGAWLIYFFVSERVKRVFSKAKEPRVAAQPSPPRFS